MSTTLMTAPAAGWYHDPADAGAWRWWDGSTWTDHVRAAAEAVAPTGPAQVGPAQLAATPMAGIPQPGEVASAPAHVGGPVSTTADIPVTDQMYWHSASAEVIEVPRLPHHTVSSEVAGPGRRSPGYVRDWQDLGSPHTVGIWLLASMPLLSIPVGLLIGVVFLMGGLPFANLAALAVTTGLCWIFAYLDQRDLGRRGYHPPNIWWMLLLPPLAYFIARGKAVRRENMRAWPPELLYVASVLVIMGASAYFAYTTAVQTGLLSAIG